MNFDQTIFENRMRRKHPFLVAHRGVNGANVPCNTLLSFQVALAQGADAVELDVSKSRDGEFFVFHPGLEPELLRCGKYISEMTAQEVRGLTLLNCDGTPTSCRIPTLQEAFALLKDKVYINVDKYWTDIPGITREIRRAGVEKQVIVKSVVDDECLAALQKHGADLMFMAIVIGEDHVTEKIQKSGVRYIGNEVIFRTEEDEVIGREYVRSMHERGLLVWVNSIVYDYKDVLTAGHSDDSALARGADYGWGWLVDRGADFVQTDWLLMLKEYLASRK